MARPDDGGADDTPDPVISEIDRWFVERGVPNFIESKTEGSALDTWTRALPLLIAAYLLLCLNAIDLRNWTVAENVLGAITGVGIGLGAWAVSNRLRKRPTFATPRDIDTPELVVFLIGPALPALMFGQPGDAFESLLLGIALLGLIYVWSAYGLGPLLRWGVREGFGQLSELMTLLAKALPLLLIFNTFLFINAEVWELAGGLQGPTYVVVIGSFFLLAATFAISRIPRFIASLSHFDSWDEIALNVADTPAAGIELPSDGIPSTPLKLGARMNIGLMVLFGQAIQILLVVVGLTSLFVLFGFFTMELATIERWMGTTGVHVLATGMLGDRELLLTEPLLRVSIFLGAFSGMYFTVLLTTDATYREEISDRVGPQIRQAVAVRTAYRVERARARRPADTAEATTTESKDHD
jgi:hypothetical protein